MGEASVVPAGPDFFERGEGGRRPGGREEEHPEERGRRPARGGAEERDAPAARRDRDAGQQGPERAPLLEAREGAGGGAGSRSEDLVELGEAALGRDAVEPPGGAPQLRESRGVEAEAGEADLESRRPDDAERVLEQDARPREPQAPRAEVVEGAGGRDEPAAGEREAEGVHGEVPPEEVVGGIALGLPDVDGGSPERDVEDPSRRPADGDGTRPREPGERLGEAGGPFAVDGEVEVPGREVEQRVADRAPDEEERDARLGGRLPGEPHGSVPREAPQRVPGLGERSHDVKGR